MFSDDKYHLAFSVICFFNKMLFKIFQLCQKLKKKKFHLGFFFSPSNTLEFVSVWFSLRTFSIIEFFNRKQLNFFFCIHEESCREREREEKKKEFKVVYVHFTSSYNYEAAGFDNFNLSCFEGMLLLLYLNSYPFLFSSSVYFIFLESVFFFCDWNRLFQFSTMTSISVCFKWKISFMINSL